MKKEEKEKKTEKTKQKSTSKQTKKKNSNTTSSSKKQNTEVKGSAENSTKKQSVKKSSEKKFSLKSFLTSTKTLLVVFCLLFVLVVALFTLVLQKRQEKIDHPDASMVIPIYKESSGYHFSISALALSARKNYIFKVTNYKNNKIKVGDFNYQVTIENSTDSKIKVVKKDEDKNLMTDDKSTTIDGGVFSHEKKQEDIYYITMTSHGDLTDKDFIRVEVSLVDNQEN